MIRNYFFKNKVKAFTLDKFSIDFKNFCTFKLRKEFIGLWHKKHKGKRIIIKVMENFEVVTFYCNKTFTKI